jgi:hypothetical protein
MCRKVGAVVFAGTLPVGVYFNKRVIRCSRGGPAHAGKRGLAVVAGQQATGGAGNPGQVVRAAIQRVAVQVDPPGPRRLGAACVSEEDQISHEQPPHDTGGIDQESTSLRLALRHVGFV